jgi:hypothetical protein
LRSASQPTSSRRPASCIIFAVTRLPLVIGGGLLYAAWPAGDWRVWAVAFLAGASVLGVERILGLRYRDRWRRLV